MPAELSDAEGRYRSVTSRHQVKKRMNENISEVPGVTGRLPASGFRGSGQGGARTCACRTSRPKTRIKCPQAVLSLRPTLLLHLRPRRYIPHMITQPGSRPQTPCLSCHGRGAGEPPRNPSPSGRGCEGQAIAVPSARAGRPLKAAGVRGWPVSAHTAEGACEGRCLDRGGSPFRPRPLASERPRRRRKPGRPKRGCGRSNCPGPSLFTPGLAARRELGQTPVRPEGV